MSLTKTRVWVRTSVLNEAAKVGKDGGGDKDWGWARATLLSGAVEQSALPEDQRTAVKVLVEDEDSPLSGKTVEIPASLVAPKKNRVVASSRPGVGKALTGASKTSSDPPIVFANQSESADLDDGNGDGADATGVGVVALLPPDDLIHLTHLHEASVTYSLRRRYQNDTIYTNTGPILIALNPFKAMPKLYGEDNMAQYFHYGEAMQRLAEDPDAEEQEEPLPPHIYSMADEAFRAMILALDPMAFGMGSTDQAILVSGESGAGKTVTTKHIMNYLATLSKRRGLFKKNATPTLGLKKGGLLPKPGSMRGSDVMRRVSRVESWTRGAVVEERILESNPILEAFGNARTIRNDNSSRFGKFIELQFKSSGSLIGASVETYLLEKVRLITQSPGERNYHVFYEVLSGATEEERARYFLKEYTVKDFKMTNGSGTYDRRDGVDDMDNMDKLFNAMRTMGFENEQMDEIFGITIACLHLSNVVFSALSADECKVDKSNGHLEAVLQLMGFEAEAFNKALCYFTIMAGRDKHSRSLSKEKAEKGLEALIKATYGGLFDYLVQTINDRITFKGTSGKAAYIGVLDIFGFEVFKKNSFEQLCINYCNETLQQQFNKVVFSTEQAEYKKEGIKWSFIEFPDNKEVIDLIEDKGTGIIPILNDMCVAPGLTDLNFARDLYKKIQNPRFEANHLHVGKNQFVVHHYALSVTYDTDGFVEKNKDELPKEAMDLLVSSSKPFVQTLAKIISPPQEPPSTPVSSGRRFGGKKKIRTVGAQFILQLKTLRTRIDSTSPHYVRCLKPNQHLGPNDFNPVLVSEQLRSLGVVEAIKLSRLGFPQRYQHDLFLHRYAILAADEIKGLEGPERIKILMKVLARKVGSAMSSVDENNMSAAKKKELAGSIDPGEYGLQIGKTKVFLQQEAFDELEKLRIEQYDGAVIKIQCLVRGHFARTIKERKKREAEERARREAEEKARREAEERARKEREEMERKRREEEERIRKEREELERKQREAEERAKREAEAAARKAAQEEANRIAKEKARLEAEAKAKKEAEEKAQREAEEKAKREAKEKTRMEAEAKAKEEAEAKVQEAEATAREAENKAKKEAEAKAKREEEEKVRLAAQRRVEQAEEKVNQEEEGAEEEYDAAIAAAAAAMPKDEKRKSTKGFFARRARSIKAPFRKSVKATAEKKPIAAASVRPNNGGRSMSFTLPPLQVGEYDVALPLTSAGFMINVGEIQGCVAFVSYRSFPDGTKGPAEKEQLIRNPGDKIVAINGTSTKNKSFREVVMLLAESRGRGMAFIRFQESQYAYPGMRIQVYPPGPQ